MALQRWRIVRVRRRLGREASERGEGEIGQKSQKEASEIDEATVPSYLGTDQVVVFISLEFDACLLTLKPRRSRLRIYAVDH